MAPLRQTCLLAPLSNVDFLLFFVFSVLFALDKCCALLTYMRQALLDISNSHNHLDSTIFLPPELSALPLELSAIVLPGSHRKRHHSQKGHKAPSPIQVSHPTPGECFGDGDANEARLKARASRPPLPSLLLANVRSLENKLDKIRDRITTQREIRECCALIFTKTWLSDKVLECTVQLQTHSVHIGDQTTGVLSCIFGHCLHPATS